MNHKSAAIKSTATLVSAGFLRKRSALSAVTRWATLSASAASRSPLIFTWMKGMIVSCAGLTGLVNSAGVRAHCGGPEIVIEEIDHARPPAARRGFAADDDRARHLRGDERQAVAIDRKRFAGREHDVARIAFHREPRRAGDAGDDTAPRVVERDAAIGVEANLRMQFSHVHRILPKGCPVAFLPRLQGGRLRRTQ